MRDGIQFGLVLSKMMCYFVRNGSFSGAQGRERRSGFPLPQNFHKLYFFSELQNCVTASSVRTSNKRQPGKGTTYGANI
jgi:hypothetical protein